MIEVGVSLLSCSSDPVCFVVVLPVVFGFVVVLPVVFGLLLGPSVSSARVVFVLMFVRLCCAAAFAAVIFGFVFFPPFFLLFSSSLRDLSRLAVVPLACIALSPF